MGAISGGLSGLFWYLSEEAYRNYLSASVSSDVIYYKEKVKLWETSMYASWGAGGAWLGIGGLFFAASPNTGKYKKEIDLLKIKIVVLEGELR